MEKRSHRRIRDLDILAAFQGLVANEIGCARISMMAREQNTPFNGPNTDARDQLSPDRHIQLAPHGRRSPWQNAYAERLIGSIRRECTDHVIVFGERHLRHLLRSYLDYYNETRTHLSLDKDAPISRAIQSVGLIFGRPVLGGLHHQYVRI